VKSSSVPLSSARKSTRIEAKLNRHTTARAESGDIHNTINVPDNAAKPTKTTVHKTKKIVNKSTMPMAGVAHRVYAHKLTAYVVLDDDDEQTTAKMSAVPSTSQPECTPLTRNELKADVATQTLDGDREGDVQRVHHVRLADGLTVSVTSDKKRK
jgi:hypothetical protein